jgi:hypothetical protein
MTDCGCKRATIRQSCKALGHIANFRTGFSALSPRARRVGEFPYLIAKSDYLLFLLWPIVGNLVSGSLSTTARSIGPWQLERKAMRYPQRLDIRFFGTQIRAEGIIGILGTIMIISVVLAAYFQS